MNKAYRLYLSVSNKLLAGLLTLLGFSIASCESEEEYGCPHATYEIKGKVVGEDGRRIPGIQVAIAQSPTDTNSPFFYQDTLRSNDRGEFGTAIGMPSFGDITFQVKTEDIDGEQNGGFFEEQTIDVAFKKSDLKGGKGNWDMGNARKDVTVTMKRAAK